MARMAGKLGLSWRASSASTSDTAPSSTMRAKRSSQRA